MMVENAAAWRSCNCIQYIIAAGIGFRSIFLIIGVWLDQDSFNLGLHFTDVDYVVFSDAGKAIYNEGSPYERPTYRYPPLLAMLCLPNHYLSWPLFGKALFVVADALLAGCIYKIVLERDLDSDTNTTRAEEEEVPHPETRVGMGEQTKTKESKQEKYAQWWALAWAFNPLSSIISARGNADSLTNVLILMTINGVLRGKRNDKYRHMIAAGSAFGLAIHLRLYPVIYAPAFWLYLTSGSLISRSMLVFMSCALISFCYFGAISYWMYGTEFLQNSYLYHTNREDPRHNFSVYFLDTYLKLSSRLVAGTGNDDSATAALNALCMTNGSNACESVSGFGSLLEIYLASAFNKTYGLVIRSFLPQILLIIFSAIRLSEANLCVCLLVQTMIFVAFNRVVTAQYFTWYLCLIPVCIPRRISQILGIYTISEASSAEGSAHEKKSAQANVTKACMSNANKSKYWSVILSASTILLTMCLWLHSAYALEMQGESTFLELWVCGVLFHAAQVVAIIVVLFIFVE